MDVHVDETGTDDPAGEIDDLRRPARERLADPADHPVLDQYVERVVGSRRRIDEPATSKQEAQQGPVGPVSTGVSAHSAAFFLTRATRDRGRRSWSQKEQRIV